MTRTEYEDLVDARDHAIAMRDVANGVPTLTDAELDHRIEQMLADITAKLTP